MERFAWFARENGEHSAIPVAIAATHILRALAIAISEGHSLDIPHKWARDLIRPADPSFGHSWWFPIETKDRRIDKSLAPAFDAIVPLIRDFFTLLEGRFGDPDQHAWAIALALISNLPGRFERLPEPDATTSKPRILAALIRPVLEQHRGRPPEETAEALLRVVLERQGLKEKAIQKALHFILQRETRNKGKP